MVTATVPAPVVKRLDSAAKEKTKTAVIITALEAFLAGSDPLLNRLDAQVRHTGKTRSELVTAALEHYFATTARTATAPRQP
jgi:predicted metal-dependent hydrolase